MNTILDAVTAGIIQGVTAGFVAALIQLLFNKVKKVISKELDK